MEECNVYTMCDRTDLLEKKRRELDAVVAETCGEWSSDEAILSAVKESLFEQGAIGMTPPQEEPPKLGFLMMDSLMDYSSGASIKPGNIKLNVKRLISDLPDLAGACDALFRETHFLKIMAFFRIWSMLWKAATIEITKRQAIVILALWKNCGNNHRITVDKGFELTNVLCRQTGEPELPEWEYSKILDDLSLIGSIELDEQGIWLREWIKRGYT